MQNYKLTIVEDGVKFEIFVYSGFVSLNKQNFVSFSLGSFPYCYSFRF